MFTHKNHTYVDTNCSLAEVSCSTVGSLTSKDMKQQNALRAKLRRLCEMKKGDKCHVPEWLHQKWKNEKGNHLEMALQLEKVNFDKDSIVSHINILNKW